MAKAKRFTFKDNEVQLSHAELRALASRERGVRPSKRPVRLP